MPTPQQNSDHFRRLDKYSRQIDAIYKQAVDEASRLISLAKYNPDKPFSFNDFPLAKKRVDEILSSLGSKMKATILKQMESEWNFSNAENDALVRSLFPTIPDDKLNPFMDRNLQALKQFQNRKDAGIGLSDRIWNYTGQMKQELEMAIDTALSDGRSSQQLSRDIRTYLNEPNRLFRRVRDKRGNLQLSKNAKAYNPGRGKYRSSYKNAMRAARTEVNMAYRMADHERAQKLAFISGFEVRLSNNHPVFDICDDLKGKYPKDFIFRGWHPQCRCHVISVLASKAELSDMTDQILAGETPTANPNNQVKSVPDGFNKWVRDNKERAKGWQSKPYFMRDNPDYVNDKIDSRPEWIKNATQDQIERAKSKYYNFLKEASISDYDVETIGYNTASQRRDFHNETIRKIKSGDRELEKEWKTFFLKQEVDNDKKILQSKAKHELNKKLSEDVLLPIRSIKRLGDYYKWLNSSKNPYRKEYFSKKYSKESVAAFLSL